jgi:hypothetical protein
MEDHNGCNRIFTKASETRLSCLAVLMCTKDCAGDDPKCPNCSKLWHSNYAQNLRLGRIWPSGRDDFPHNSSWESKHNGLGGKYHIGKWRLARRSRIVIGGRPHLSLDN